MNADSVQICSVIGSAWTESKTSFVSSKTSEVVKGLEYIFNQSNEKTHGNAIKKMFSHIKKHKPNASQICPQQFELYL